MANYAGVDWASEKHDVVVQDEAGEELLAASLAHDAKGLRSLCRTLMRMEVTLVAIERPDGLLVERLLDAGLRLLPLHPNQWHPWAADHYARAIARGHDHPRATRTLGRAWCRVVWSCWQNRTPYDPTRHRGIGPPARPRRHRADARRRRHRQGGPKGRAQRA